MFKIGINGLGRIGRLALRKIIESDFDIQIVAVNDLADLEDLAYLIKYDSSQGVFKKNISIDKENSILKIDKQKIKVFSYTDPEEINWGSLDIDLVIESTGFFTTQEKAKKHLNSGAKKVIISAPSDKDIKTIVFGVNHKTLQKGDDIISGASCTTNCLAPMAKVIDDNFKILNGFMNTIHAYTNDQSTLDTIHKKDLRRGRSAANNIVPSSTGAAKAIGLVIPSLDGILIGSSQRVPVITGSVTELVVSVQKQPTVEKINHIMLEHSNDSFGYISDPIVSSDIIGTNYGSIFDPSQTMVNYSNDISMIKVAAWYDNEMSYTSQLIRTINYWLNL